MRQDVIFSCGHKGNIDLYGDKQHKEHMLWVAENRQICAECEAKQREDDDKRARDYAKEMKLPALSGSEKQVDWALRIRQSFIDKLHNRYDKRTMQGAEKYYAALDYALDAYRKASEWIDSRELGLNDILRIYQKDIDTAKEKKAANAKADAETLEQITLRPENPSKSGIAEIKVFNSHVDAKYMKDDTFREIVKASGFTWYSERSCWTRAINATSGKAEDRAAEIASKLLKGGFTVQLSDSNAQKMVKDGTWEPEFPRWIVKAGEKWFAIKHPQSDKLYNASRRLPGNKWQAEMRRVIVPLDAFVAVAEYARLYDFRITEKAQEMMDRMENAEMNAETITPVINEPAPEKDGLAEMLKGSREVIEDLRDDT